MNQECRDAIIKNFVFLMKQCNVDSLKKVMVDKGIFSEREIKEIFSTNDVRHNKRVFFFNVQKKERAWIPLLEALNETHQDHIAEKLARRGAKVFSEMTPDCEEDLEELADLNNVHVNNSTDSLNIKVTHSERFYDTFEHNENVEFYKSRSKKRGRVLIINNYEFKDPQKHPYRNGAIVDDQNLIKMFKQMGGWDIDHHNNKTAQEMDQLIKQFSIYENNYLYDICFMIIMSHGSQHNNDTIIYGVDENYIFSLDVQTLFSNENCKTWRAKPKIMVFAVCRGIDLQININHKMRTETDSVCNNSQATNTSSFLSVRPQEDVLIGYATLPGFKAHRDPNRGAWYIELLCKIVMDYAHKYPVDDLMMMIDQQLRYRMSESRTMQTAEYRNKGFKRLYLHPGIYIENDRMKKYLENN